MARILALDVGKKRIGLAMSDELRIIAQGLPTFKRTTIRDDMYRMAAVIAERDVGLLLIGHPLHMSGHDSRQAVYVREFGDRLSEETGIPCEYWDERLTSIEANRVLKESGISIEKRARAVDKLAAMILLESYLERLSLCGG